MPPAKDDGTPKLLIETQNLFGPQKIEKVEVDSNRLDPIATTRQRMIQFMIHPYLIDALGDGIAWVSGTAFLVSILRYTPFLQWFQIPFLVFVLVIGAAAFFVLVRAPEVSGAVVLRTVLVLVGLFLGVMA